MFGLELVAAYGIKTAVVAGVYWWYKASLREIEAVELAAWLAREGGVSVADRAQQSAPTDTAAALVNVSLMDSLFDCPAPPLPSLLTSPQPVSPFVESTSTTTSAANDVNSNNNNKNDSIVSGSAQSSEVARVEVEDPNEGPLQLVDVRTEYEFSASHIAGSIHVPLLPPWRCVCV